MRKNVIASVIVRYRGRVSVSVEISVRVPHSVSWYTCPRQLSTK